MSLERRPFGPFELPAPDGGAGCGAGGVEEQGPDVPDPAHFRFPSDSEGDAGNLPGADNPQSHLFPDEPSNLSTSPESDTNFESGIPHAEQNPQQASSSPKLDTLLARNTILARWHQGELDPETSAWVEQEYPFLPKQRAHMDPEEFDHWFVAWWLDGLFHGGDFLGEEELE